MWIVRAGVDSHMTGLVFLISESRTAFFVHESVLELCQTTSARRKQSNPGGGERKKNKKKITFLPLLPGGQLQIVGGVHLALAGLPAWQERVGGGDGEVLHARTLPELEPMSLSSGSSSATTSTPNSLRTTVAGFGRQVCRNWGSDRGQRKERKKRNR